MLKWNKPKASFYEHCLCIFTPTVFQSLSLFLSLTIWVFFPVVVLNTLAQTETWPVGFLSLIPSTTIEVKPSMICTTQAKYMYISHCYHKKLLYWFCWKMKWKITFYLWSDQLISWHDCQNMCNHGNYIDNTCIWLFMLTWLIRQYLI